MRLYPSLTVDGEFKALRDAGYNGSLNDMQFAFLRSEGYSGALGDMQYQFTGGDAPGPGPGSEHTWTMTAGEEFSGFIGYTDTNGDGAPGGGSISNQPFSGLILRNQLYQPAVSSQNQNPGNILAFFGDVRSSLPSSITLTVDGTQYTASGLAYNAGSNLTNWSTWSEAPVYVNGTTYNCSIS